MTSHFDSRLIPSLVLLLQYVLLPTLLLVLNAPDHTHAQVATNITSSGLGTVVPDQPPPDGVYDITGGYRPGGGPNLFHSFGNFSVGNGDIANFLNETGLQTTSILGRVTGGDISNIYGTIQTTGFGNAHLFLINPSGFLFGPNGSLTVGGSVGFTTADYVRLSDGVNSANFYANPANDSLGNNLLTLPPLVDFGFLQAEPAAYGFLSQPNSSVPITVQGSALSVPSGNSISLVGGGVVIQSGTLPDGTVQSAQLSAPNGRILLVNTASPGEIEVATLKSLPNVDGSSFSSFGSVLLAPGSSIDVSGAETVFLIGGQLVLSVNDATLSTSEVPAPSDTISLSPGSSIVTSTSSTDFGADAQITAGTLQLDGALVQTINTGDGAGGDISINATTVALTNGTFIHSSTGLDFNTSTVVGSGKGGNVTVQGLQGAGSAAHTFTLSNGSTITAQMFGLGHGGNILISSDTVRLDTFASIDASNFSSADVGVGVGGDVTINVNTLALTDSARIGSLGQTFSPGFQGGNLTIQGLAGLGSAAKSVAFSGGSTLTSGTFGSGDGGRVAITSKSLTMDGAGTIVNASAAGQGRGGDIVLSVQQASLSGGAAIISDTTIFEPTPFPSGTITIAGLEGTGSQADTLTLAGSSINSIAFGENRLGDIEVHAKTVSLTDGAVIEAGNLSGLGTAGNVTIDADSLGLSGGSRIASQAFATDAGEVTITANRMSLNHGSIETGSHGFGRGGDVVLNVGTVSFSNGATINSSSSGVEAGAGNAGNVTITSSGPFTSNASTIVTSAENARAGSIDVTAQRVALVNGAAFSTSSSSVPHPDGGGNAGNLTVRSGSTVVMHNSVMTAEASQASGGQLTITTPEMLWLTNSRISTSVFDGNFASSGGNITIDPQFVILQNSQIIANSVFGLGGAIDIIAGVFLADPASIVTASSTLGISGTIVPLSGQLVPLTQQVSNATASLVANRCAADPTGQFSSFVQVGRDGVPQVPGALSPSPLSFLETLTSGSLGSPGPNWAAAQLGLDSVSDPALFRFHSACRS